tara:strand:- start:4518 stop:5657 length:1140 start_codon:yes stop_codon:yes gene_type:complete
MTKKLCFVTSTRFQKKDFQRFGLDIINKKYEIAVIDLSKIINKRSNIVFKKYKYKNLYEFDNFFDLYKFFKKNSFKYVIDDLNNSFYEVIARLIFIFFNIKSIKYIGGLKPPILYKYVYGEQNKINKLREIPIKILSYIKRKFLIIINKKLIKIVMITGKDPQNLEGYLNKKILRIYTHGYDYNYFLKMKKLKKIQKNYILYIDQNFISHADFFIKKRSAFVGSNFYNSVEKFLQKISKVNNCDFKIALHPKSILNKSNFKTKKKCYVNLTPELIQQSKYVLCHYSTAVSFAILFKKPIITLTSIELDNVRAGSQIRSMSKILKTPLYVLESQNQNFKLANKYDKSSYKNYLNNYIKHPKSNNINSWVTLLNSIKNELK